MAGKCSLCAGGPQGIAGHERLELVQKDERVPDAVAFKCVICLNIWLRTYEGSGVFKWTLAETIEARR